MRKFSRSRRRAESAQALGLQGAQANQSSRHEEAARLLISAIAAEPEVAEFHYELGRAMRGLAEPERAVTCFRKAIELDAAHRDAWIDLASVMIALGDPEASEAAARSALLLAPRSVPALANLGAALAGQGKFSAAAESYRSALAIDADCVPALANLGAACLQLGSLEEARLCVERALRIAPLEPGLHIQQGNISLEQKLPEEAMACFREALRLDPGSVAARNSLGLAYDLQGKLESAMMEYERALATDPDDVQAHLGRAAIRLLEEDYARGWEEYEWRRRGVAHAPLYRRFGLPEWDGTPLAGCRILVYAEQGLGDEILFASCLPEIVAQAAHCVIDCEPRLAGLVQRAFPRATVHGGKQTDAVDWLASAGPVDLQAPAGSLPRRLRRSPEAFPRHAGYLRASPERIAAWNARLQQLGPGRKIGLSWRGGVPQTGRGSRSIGLAELLPILRLEGVSFVSLQYGPCGEELAALRQRHGIEIHHWQDAIDDYEETAALVCALDLTLSVCTAVVDLAGALGRPVWVMAPVRSDFRYGLRGDAMRWYPSARIFRQATFGEWAPVLEAVASELAMAAG